MSVWILQNLGKYRILWTDFLASCREINRFPVSKIGPEPAKLTISLALVHIHMLKQNSFLTQLSKEFFQIWCVKILYQHNLLKGSSYFHFIIKIGIGDENKLREGL